MMMRPAALHFTFSTLNSSPDGDGLANDIDPSPMQYDGDFFGTSVAWYNANCSGVMQAATNALGETEMTWNASTNPDAYYWLDLSATGVLGVTTIRVTCDGPSDLGDMTIIARTNMVCHIPMLAGATYMIESDLPFDGVSASDNRV